MTKSPTGSHKKIVILGATSAIAESTARRLADANISIALVARNAVQMNAIADDLTLRGAPKVTTHVLELVACQDKADAFNKIAATLGRIDGVLLFYGTLGDQARANGDSDTVNTIIDANFTSAAEWLTVAVPALEKSEAVRPILMAISSVAGDRGRRSNYAYGAAKGGLSIFVQGMAHRFAENSKIRAVTMKLGFVKTPMTAHLDQSGALWSEPDDIAKTIVKAMSKGGPVVYAPGIWKFIMLAIRITPSFVFNRVNL